MRKRHTAATIAAARGRQQPAAPKLGPNLMQGPRLEFPVFGRPGRPDNGDGMGYIVAESPMISLRKSSALLWGWHGVHRSRVAWIVAILGAALPTVANRCRFAPASRRIPFTSLCDPAPALPVGEVRRVNVSVNRLFHRLSRRPVANWKVGGTGSGSPWSASRSSSLCK